MIAPMEKYHLIILISLLTVVAFSVRGQQFNTQGTASQTGPFTYEVTPNALSQAGMITNFYPLNLKQNFELSFQFNFGTNDANGADGFAFLMSKTCSPQLVVGNGLGVSGINNSLIVEFDTWNNGDPLNDISNDHTGIYSNGQLNLNGNIMDGTNIPVCLLPNCGNVEDGQWYNVRILWEYQSATLQKLSVFFNGTLRAASTRNHIVERFNNDTTVFWSIGASTGAATNLQQFRVAASNNNNINTCVGKPFTLRAPELGTAYNWSGGSSSTTNTATFVPGVTVITCNYIDYCGSPRTVNFNVLINENPQVFLFDALTCEAKPTLLAAAPNQLGAYLFNWSVPTGVSQPQNNQAVISSNVAGVYTVSITDTITSCSSNPTSATLTTTPAVRPQFLPIDTICAGSVVPPLPETSLNGINGKWSPAVNNQQTTRYYFTPDSSVCAFPDSMVIVVNKQPVVNWNSTANLCTGDTLQLSPLAEGYGLRYLWQNGNTDSTLRITQSGLYAVAVSNGCGTVNTSVVVTEIICQVYIPSAFTPNGDGLNDIFRINGASFVKDFEFRIFNRWGEQIFRSQNPELGWDGTFKGKRQPAGTYTYKINYTLKQTGEIKQVAGTFILLE
jgi:gliding motility-associated-like protein